MKCKDLQNIVLSMYRKGDIPTKIHRHLNGAISLTTIKIWCQMIRQSDSIHLLDTCVVQRIIRALKRIYKKLKTVCTEHRRYHLENFRGSFCNKCRTSIENRFRVQTLSKDNRIVHRFPMIKRSNGNSLQIDFKQISEKKTS